MKIVCKKETNIKQTLELIKHLLETDCIDYPILKDDLILNLSLKDANGQSCPNNEQNIYLDEKDLQNTEISADVLEYYYNTDALTKLYNRGKYERDIVKLQTNDTEAFSCIYIDAVGLHEINNHLGHAAGDHMLCSIADGIRKNFTHSSAYRIGGDEFVVFCLNQDEAATKQKISDLKAFLKQENYEISVGMKNNSDCLTIMETINQAEHAMRHDKMEFYQQNGAKRQIRSLNHKLEKILLEKQDANQFLNVIAAEYKGVYMVNPEKDTCRYIYIPEYFKEILKKNDGVFSKSIYMYCDMFVCEKDKAGFQALLDFDYILKQIKQGNQVKFTYEKKDGSKIDMQITIYDSNACNNNEMLWIFMDGDR